LRKEVVVVEAMKMSFGDDDDSQEERKKAVFVFLSEGKRELQAYLYESPPGIRRMVDRRMV